MWSQPCAHVVFDTDPAPRGRTDPAQAEEMSQAMIRSDVKPFLGFHSITSFHITPPGGGYSVENWVGVCR